MCMKNQKPNGIKQIHRNQISTSIAFGPIEINRCPSNCLLWSSQACIGNKAQQRGSTQKQHSPTTKPLYTLSIHCNPEYCRDWHVFATLVFLMDQCYIKLMVTMTDLMTQCGGDGHGDDGVGSIGGKGGQGLALTQAEVSRTGGYTRGQLSTNPRTGGTRELRQLQLLHHQHQCRGHPLTTPIATQTTPPLPYQCSKQQGNLTVKALRESLSWGNTDTANLLFCNLWKCSILTWNRTKEGWAHEEERRRKCF